MPRIRTLKPELWQDEAVGTLSRDARLLFVGLITQADDDGRLRGSPSLIRSQVFPYDIDLAPAEIDTWLAELEAAELIVRYGGVRPYIALRSWEKHQRISHRSASDLPSPDDRNSGPPEPSTHPPEASRKAPERVYREGKGRDQGETPVPSESRQTKQIFDRWVASTGRDSRTKLTPGRRQAIRARLREGYSAERICAAIDNVAASPFHQGHNDRGRRFDDLTLICRNGEQLEAYEELRPSDSSELRSRGDFEQAVQRRIDTLMKTGEVTEAEAREAAESAERQRREVRVAA